MSEESKDVSSHLGSEKEETLYKAGTAESSIPTFTHTEAMGTAREMLAGLIMNDPLLRDLDPHVTLEEVNSMIALEYGQAMSIYVRRADNELIPVVITQKARVIDLKHAIKRTFTLRQIRAGGSTHLSWKHIWKRHWLSFNGEKLMDDNQKLKSYGIRNRDSVTFVKRLREH